MRYTKVDKNPQDFLETARQEFANVAGSIQNASEPLTLEAICELLDIAEAGVKALNAAINVTIDNGLYPKEGK
jgi:hypothetical protein